MYGQKVTTLANTGTGAALSYSALDIGSTALGTVAILILFMGIASMIRGHIRRGGLRP